MRGRLPLRAYGLLSEMATPFAAAHALSRGGWSTARQALALCAPPPRTPSNYMLWIHGASIGETCSALPLVRTLLAQSPSATVLMTASTPTALARLSMERLGPRVVLQARPIDGTSVVRRFLRRWRPSALLLVESELWPNLVMRTREAGIPIALVNARLSERSLARWSAAAPSVLRTLLSCSSVTLAQSPRMADVLQGFVGGAPVKCVGDLKQVRGHRRSAAVDSGGGAAAAVRAALSARRCDSVWLAASTHGGDEEAAVLEAHAALRAGPCPDLLLLLVPRHPERGAAVASAAASAASAAAAGWCVALHSAGDAVTTATGVYVCDTLGELPSLYALAGVAFVGGSLASRGGHSILEAAQAAGGCVVLHGPHTEAVECAAATLAATEPPAARRVRDAAELAAQVRLLLCDAPLRTACRAAASAAALELERGVLDRIWSELEGPLGLPPL